MCRCPATVESLAVPLHWDGTGAPAQGPGSPERPATRYFPSPHLRRLIYPCRSLCEALQASCAPIMACYGYPWPAILHCGRFPAGHSLCVAAVSVGSRLGRPRESPRGPQAMSTGSAPPFQAAPRRARYTGLSGREDRDWPQQQVSERVKIEGPMGGLPQPALTALPPLSAGGASLGPSPPPPSAARQLQGLRVAGRPLIQRGSGSALCQRLW